MTPGTRAVARAPSAMLLRQGWKEAAMASPSSLPSGAQALPPFLTVKEAAVYLRLNVKTVYAAITAGYVRSVRFGRTLRIPREALTALSDGVALPEPLGHRRERRNS
jgi:excisionase family DNA binding protein